MKVIHVIEPFASGVTTAVINITRENRDMQHIIIHGSRTWVDSIENVKNKFPPEVEFINWKYADREINPVKDTAAFFQLIKILKKHKKAVIHLHSSKAGFLGRAACGVLGIKSVIYTPHCPAFIRTDIGKFKRNIFKYLEIIGSKLGGRIVGCGQSEAELFNRMGIKADWVANGVAPVTGNTGSAPRKEYVTFVGIANEQKNPGMFNSIAEKFTGKNVKFRWVGDGYLKDRLTSQNIMVTGWVDKEQVEEYLSETLIYLSTSGWEGLPFGVLEAMNYSCALLLTDVPGNRDLVIKGENGFLFSDIGQAAEFLDEMIKNREQTVRMGKASRKLIEDRFSAENMGKGYRKIYESIIS